MGYFANGTEGDLYIARWCARCVHWKTDPNRGEGCPVYDLHLLYNYDQLKKASTRAALEMLIPATPDGGNAQCSMFWERGTGLGGGQPVPVTAHLSVVRAA